MPTNNHTNMKRTSLITLTLAIGLALFQPVSSFAKDDAQKGNGNERGKGKSEKAQGKSGGKTGNREQTSHQPRSASPSGRPEVIASRPGKFSPGNAPVADSRASRATVTTLRSSAAARGPVVTPSSSRHLQQPGYSGPGRNSSSFGNQDSYTLANNYGGLWVHGDTHRHWDRNRVHFYNNHRYGWYEGGWLTGGVDAARGVAARAGQNVKKTTMELGGDDAFIVLADADLNQAVKWAVWAKMNNMGQCSVAAKRFIVVAKLYDRFLAKFQTALAAFTPGDPMDPATTLAPLSTEAALVTLLAQVKRAVAKGATVALGGKRIDRPGSFMQPTILTNIKPANPAYREEFFGPVALFFRVKNENEAVALANDSDFGLGGSVFTQDVARGQRAASARPADSTPAWCSSTTRHGRQRTCRLAASRIPDTGANSPASASRSS